MPRPIGTSGPRTLYLKPFSWLAERGIPRDERQRLSHWRTLEKTAPTGQSILSLRGMQAVCSSSTGSALRVGMFFGSYANN